MIKGEDILQNICKGPNSWEILLSCTALNNEVIKITCLTYT